VRRRSALMTRVGSRWFAALRTPSIHESTGLSNYCGSGMGYQQHVQERVSLVHRYYDPATQQFLSIDPAVNATGTPYAYVQDGPVNGTDPTGLGGGGNCDSTNAARQNACVKAERAASAAANRACPSGYYNGKGQCDPALATEQTYNPPSWPMDVIYGVGGAFFCSSGLGTAVCIGGGLTITADNAGSDIENGCSAGTVGADTAIGLAGTGLGWVSALGGGVLDSAPGWERAIYGGTTNAPSGAQGAMQAAAGSPCC